MIDFPLERPAGLSDDEWEHYVHHALSLLMGYTPVRTGRLRAGWNIAHLDGDSAMITNDVPYAGFVDAGTPHMYPRDMTGHTLRELM